MRQPWTLRQRVAQSERTQAARTRIADRTWQSVYNILETASNEADRGAGRSTSADAWAALAR